MKELAKYMTDNYMVVAYYESVNLYIKRSSLSLLEQSTMVEIPHNEGTEWFLKAVYERSSIDLFNRICEEIDAREVVLKVAKRFGVDKDAKTFY